MPSDVITSGLIVVNGWLCSVDEGLDGTFRYLDQSSQPHTLKVPLYFCHHFLPIHALKLFLYYLKVFGSIMSSLLHVLLLWGKQMETEKLFLPPHQSADIGTP